MKFSSYVTTTLYLAAFAYLGFYAYGLVMGVYTPGQMIGLTAIAGAMALACGLHAFQVHRAMQDPVAHRQLVHGARVQRERRGF